MRLESAVFADNEPIPPRYSGEGADISPPLRWDEPAEDAAEFALLVEDPDAPRDEPFVHWLVYSIPGNARELHEALPQQARVAEPGGLRQGLNSFDEVGYRGPMPPVGHGTHHYHFHLYALRRPLQLNEPAPKDRLLRAIHQAGIIEEAELVGLYER